MKREENIDLYGGDESGVSRDEMDKERHDRNNHINIGKYCHSSICDEVYALTHRAVTNATIIGTIMDLIKKDKNLANEN